MTATTTFEVVIFEPKININNTPPTLVPEPMDQTIFDDEEFVYALGLPIDYENNDVSV